MRVLFVRRTCRWGAGGGQTLGANGARPEARRLLARYRAANVALASGEVYLVAVIVLSSRDVSPALCFLVSFDVLLLPFLFGPLDPHLILQKNKNNNTY